MPKTSFFRPVLSIAVAALATLTVPSPSLAQAQPREAFPIEEVEECVEKAVTFLLSIQQPDGYFTEEGGGKKDRPPNYGNVMSALAIMGLAAVGHSPSEPTPEGEAMGKALEYMLQENMITENGYLGQIDNSRMYGHGVITLMYAEMLGMGRDAEQDALVADRCQRGIDLILESQGVNKGQSHAGGWRYEPGSNDSDLSATIWQLMALRAAKNAGLKVPKDAIDKAVAYVQRCYCSRRDGDGVPVDRDQGFSYTAGGGGAQPATTAAGVLSLQVCGQYDAVEVEGGVVYLSRRPPQANSSWFFYGLYYYAQGMNQRGGEVAINARNHTENILLSSQQGDGSWHAKNGSENRFGKVYATSLSLLSLSVRHGYLPIYQR